MLVLRHSLFSSAALVALTAAWWVGDLAKFYSADLGFDDAFMYWRYALHMRDGLGWSWNLDGRPTYGETSLLWGVAVWGLTFLPLSMGRALMLGSWVTSGMALVATAHAVARNAQGAYLSRTWQALPVVALPIAIARPFLYNATTGMDTMLALLTNSVFVGTVLAWSRGKVRAVWVGLAGALCFLARPESALATVAMTLLAWRLGRGVARRDPARLLAAFGAIVAIDLVLAKLYFHTALPLGFYMKSGHAYEGYPARWHPVLLAMDFLSGCGLFLLCIAMFARRRDVRLLAICIVPALLTFAYLFTVTQIMGYDARFYVPYFPFFAVPAALLLDARLADGQADLPGAPLMRYAAAGVVLFFAMSLYPQRAMLSADRLIEGRKFAYDDAVRTVPASRPLPEVDNLVALNDVARILVQPLPKGATVAATEVGYLGALAPQVNVIDLAGLNDTEIALNGFKTAALLARRPDLIWMPHLAYTYQRGLIFADPDLLRDYVVVDGAALFGIAFRKDSAYRAQIEREMQTYWDLRYPGYSMKDYVVQSVSWDGKKHEVRGED